MRLIASLLLALSLASPVSARASQDAITAFNAWCFMAGQTASTIRANMEQGAGTPLPFELTFWDISIEPVANELPRGIERRCEVLFEGEHTSVAKKALRTQMATPPVFGKLIELPDTHRAGRGTALIEGRELFKGRVAVVHVGLREGKTFMVVDRLFDGLGWKLKSD